MLQQFRLKPRQGFSVSHFGWNLIIAVEPGKHHHSTPEIGCLIVLDQEKLSFDFSVIQRRRNVGRKDLLASVRPLACFPALSPVLCLLGSTCLCAAGAGSCDDSLLTWTVIVAAPALWPALASSDLLLFFWAIT